MKKYLIITILHLVNPINSSSNYLRRKNVLSISELIIPLSNLKIIMLIQYELIIHSNNNHFHTFINVLSFEK